MMKKIVMKASEIPLDSKITKLKGEKQYILRNRIRFFGKNNSTEEVRAKDGMLFLVDPRNGDVNSIFSNIELIWHTDEDILGLYVNVC